jgi:hypothetical protein
VREADRVHKMFCFEADYRQRVAAALRLAGLREEAGENGASKAEAVPPGNVGPNTPIK